MRVLVTGAQGFVGRHLAAELRRRGHEVWTCDLKHEPDARALRCDVTQYRQLLRVFEGRSFEYVYHLAAEFGRWNGEDFYEAMWSTNVVGTKNVLRLQEAHGFRLIFFSSSEVYGDWQGVMSEDVMDLHEIRQLNDYAISKWVGELQVMNTAAACGTEAVRVRLFNLYGPGEPVNAYRSALVRFVHAAVNDERFVVYGSHTRSWLYVEDAVATLANIADNYKPDEVYNLGSEDPVTMRELAELILRLTGRDGGRADHRDEEPRTTRHKHLDCSKARRDLGHRPTVSLEEGLRRTVAWVRQEYGPAVVDASGLAPAHGLA